LAITTATAHYFCLVGNGLGELRRHWRGNRGAIRLRLERCKRRRALFGYGGAKADAGHLGWGPLADWCPLPRLVLGWATLSTPRTWLGTPRRSEGAGSARSHTGRRRLLFLTSGNSQQRSIVIRTFPEGIRDGSAPGPSRCGSRRGPICPRGTDSVSGTVVNHGPRASSRSTIVPRRPRATAG
jgi:hypothetical protein